MISIRKAGLEDWSIIQQWENDPSLWSISDESGPFSEDQIQHFLLHQNNLIHHLQERWLVLLDILPIGMLDLFQWDNVNNEIGVGIVIMDLRHRGLGYGREAMHKMESVMKWNHGIEKFWAIVWIKNRSAIEFFAKCGYSLTEEILHQQKKAYKFEKKI